MAKIYLSPSSQTANLWTDGTSEAERMQEFSDLIKPLLEDEGHTVYGSDNTKFGSDNSENRNSRIKEANDNKVDIYVSLHSNAGGGKGPRVYYYSSSTKGKTLATAINSTLTKLYGNTSQKIVTGNYDELTLTKAPAVIIEIAFHDNTSDVKWMKKNQSAIAEAISKGVCNYF